MNPPLEQTILLLSEYHLSGGKIRVPPFKLTPCFLATYDYAYTEQRPSSHAESFRVLWIPAADSMKRGVYHGQS